MAKRINIRPRQSKPKGDSDRAARQFELNVMGGEPTSFSPPLAGDSDPRLSDAYTWYNVRIETKEEREDAKRVVVDYLKQHSDFTQADVKAYRSSDLAKTTNSMFANARMIANGIALPPGVVERFHAKLRDVIASPHFSRFVHEDSSPPEDAKPKGYQPSIAERVREAKSDLIAEFEGMIDDGVEFSAYEFLQKKQVKPALAMAVVEKFQPALSEMKDAQSKKCPQLVEAYRGLGSRELNKLVSLYENVVEEAKRYANNEKAARVKKPRKRKEKSAAALVTKMKYMREFRELMIVSVDPAQIPGASDVFLFNTKYNTLTHLSAMSRDGFTVSGSTIKNFDESRSFRKTLRKPAEAIQKVLSGKKAESIDSFIKALSTKPAGANGRVNEETIVLRVIR